MKLSLFFILVTITSFTIAQKNAKPYDKGEFRLKLALPHLNQLTIKPFEDARSSDFGFLGEGIGVEYSYADRHFVEVQVALAIASNRFFPFPHDREGAYKVLSTTYVSLTNYHLINRLSFGYGIHYARNYIAQGYRSTGGSTNPPYFSNDKWHQTVGLMLSTFYRLFKRFNFGLVYRPSVLRIGKPSGLVYDHLISFEMNWKFRLNDK